MESIDPKENEEFDIKIEKDIRKIFEISRIWFERCGIRYKNWKRYLKFRGFDLKEDEELDTKIEKDIRRHEFEEKWN